MPGFSFKIILNAFDVYDSVMPMYLLTYMTGITPILSKNQSIRTTIFGYLFGILHFIAFILCFLITVYRKESIIAHFFENDLTRFGDLLLGVTGGVFVLVIFLCSFCTNKFSSILDILTCIDNEFTKFGIFIHYQKFLRQSYTNLLIIFIINWSYYIGSYEILKLSGINPSFEVYTTFCIPYIIMSLVLIKFIGTSKLISFRISLLNKVLEAYLNRLKPDYHLMENENMKKNKKRFCEYIRCSFTFDEVYFFRLRDPIKLVMQIHNLLCDVSLLLEDSLGYQMLTIIAVSFLYIIFDGYYILQVLVNPETNGGTNLKTEVIIFFAIQLFLYVMIIAGINESSYGTMQENSQSLINVHKILSFIDDSNEKETLIALSLQLTNRDVRFSAAGLFYLDRALYFTIAGATTTYLIILIQFSSFQIPGIANLYNASNT